MGAGASICDEEDLIKEFDKERFSLPEAAVEELEALYHNPAVQKKGEFYVIGKCRERFGELQVPAPAQEEKMDAVLGVSVNNNPTGFLNREMMDAVEIDDGDNLDQQLGQNLTNFLPALGPDAYKPQGQEKVDGAEGDIEGMVVGAAVRAGIGEVEVGAEKSVEGMAAGAALEESTGGFKRAVGPAEGELADMRPAWSPSTGRKI
jgi:hypothetical protein